MHLSVVTASRSPQIGDGLTYDDGGKPVAEGDLVRVLLRRKVVEGIVVAKEAKISQEQFTIKPVEETLGSLLPPAQAVLARWMADEYVCSLRSILTVMLPPPPWSKLLLDRVVDVTKVPSRRPQIHDGEAERATRIMAEPRPTVCWMGLEERTALYVALIVEALSRGRQVVVVFPEVMLAKEAARQFAEHFGDAAVTLLHSRQTPKQRRDAWKAIRSGERRIVVGTRTALFVPCAQLGLLILDDEQERTYKSEETPRYLARPVAERLCVLASAKLVLGTSVPSVDLYAKTATAAMHLVRTSAVQTSSPLVQIVDLHDVSFGKAYPFSPALLRAIADRLQRGEQSVLLFNRRGAGTALLCKDCRRRVVSRDGNVPLAVHCDTRGNPYLVDHATGLRGSVPGTCPSCGSPRLSIIGAGTQSVETLLRRLFPTARILRSDRDAAKREDTEDMLEMLRRGVADILVGTRGIVKSFALPSVTLAAVLLADTGLSVPDFRAGERVFQLIAQLREAHALKPRGSLIIQTYRPDAPEIALAASDPEKYLHDELMLRTAMGYPPATRIVRLLLRGVDAQARADALGRDLSSILPKGGSCTAGTLLHDSRVWQVLLRCDNPHALLKRVDRQRAVVDVDPLETA